jgi:hypothetical protein
LSLTITSINVTTTLALPSAVDEETAFPDRRLRMTGRTARVTFIGPMRLVISRCSTCAGVSSSKKPAQGS